MIILTTIFEARKNGGAKLWKLHKPYSATMKKYYRKIINTKCQLTMYSNLIQKQRIAKLVFTNLFDLDKNVLKDNFTISRQRLDEYKS